MLIIFIFTVFFQQETLSKKANITSALEEGSHKFGAEENGFANQEMDMSNIVSPSSRPRIISQEILKPNDLPNNLTEMMNSNVPLQNIRNKFSLGAHENLPDKQIYTLKKTTHEKAKANITSALQEASQKCGAEENGFASQKIDMSDIESPPSRPQIISQEKVMPSNLPNNLTEKINSNVPLQNITNKCSLGAHKNLSDKQIYTLKKITNEKTKPLEKESNENLNIQKIIKVPERINFSSPIQQKDVNERSLNYLRRIQDLKQQINNLNKELQNKTKECERLQKTI